MLSITIYEVANLEQTLCMKRIYVHLILVMVCHRNISQLSLKHIVVSQTFHTIYYNQLHFTKIHVYFSYYIYRSCDTFPGGPPTTPLKMSDHQCVFLMYSVVIILCVLRACISNTLNIGRQKRYEEVIYSILQYYEKQL